MSEQSQNIKPKNRLQHLLAKIAGNDTAKAIKPKMKNEFYLNDIADEGGGGGEPFVVTFSGTTGDASCDKTHPEIYEAWKSGQQIVVDYDQGDGESVIHNLPYRCDVAGIGDHGFYFSAFLFDTLHVNTLSHFTLSSVFNDRSFVYEVSIARADYALTPQV